MLSRCLFGVFLMVIGVPHLVRVTGPQVVAVGDFTDDGKTLPSNAQMEKLAASDPVAFLEYCLRRHEREVEGYQVTLEKQERIRGTLEKKEIIDVWFREKPHSVLFKWREGHRLAVAALYVEGENLSGGKSMIVAKPFLGFLAPREIDPKSPEARNSGRYPLTEFGLKFGLQRTLASWRSGKNDEALHVTYQGIRKVEELGGRSCHVFKRDRFLKPEGPDKVTEQVLYVDVENWLLVGTVLKNEKDELVARYFFRDVKLNPKFADDQFARKNLKK